jgi:dolichol-phosphate mannosyltransferase
MDKVLIIIPTYNESESILQLLARIVLVSKTLESKYKIDILIVDDNSPDKTSQIALSSGIKNLHVIVHGKKGGIGPAYLAGFEYGLKGDYSYFVEMDADLSHQPEQLPQLLAGANSRTLVIGTRWIAGGAVINWPKRRRLISRFGTAYASIVLGLDCKDLTSGYRVLPRELLKTIELSKIRSSGYGFQIEIALNAVRSKFDLVEVPITFIERENGRSKMSLGIVVEAWKMVSYEGIRRLYIRR